MAYLVIDGEKIEIGKDQNFMEVEDKSGIPYACRAGVCQTCAVTIKKGEEFLSELNDNEEMMGAEGNHRLACQLSCNSEDAVVELDLGWV